MIYELALVSVVIGAGYWGVFFVRRRPHGTATFGIMQLAAAALAGLGLVGHALAVPALGIAGAVGVGAGLCLLVIGPLARGLARWAVTRERMALAIRLLDLAELLAPGSGVAEERALVRAMAEIREGRIEPTVDALTAARERAPDEARLAIDERIALLYLAAHRWGDAIAHAEAHLFGAPPPRDGDDSLRGALGFAPPVWVDLLGAYGRLGDLDRAARMLARLEDVCAGRDDAAVWIHRARMMFLALAGRTEAVRALVAPGRARHMTVAARTYWIAVAHEHQGDRTAAAAAYRRARSRSRGRPRELIERALAGLGESRPTELPAIASEVVARVEAAPLPPPIHVTRPPRPRATWLLTACVIGVAAVTRISVGDTGDIGVLIRAGGLARAMVADGEWWRLISCVFVHVGIAHLVVNALGLIVLGRLAEDLFGSARTLAIFAVAGIAGSVASYAASPVGISAGASGAVFGLLGAVFVEISWHRQRYRAAWKRGLWGGLAVVTVSQLGLGFFSAVIDQWAHGAGLAAGALLGLALSRHARWLRAGGVLARALAIGFAAAALVAAVFVAGTPLGDSLAGGAAVRRVVAGVAIAAPARWQVSTNQLVHGGEVERTEGQLLQPDGLVIVTITHQPRTDPARQIATWLADEGRHARDELGELAPAAAPVLAPQPGWEGGELVAAPEDGMGYRQRVRVVLRGRVFGDRTIFVAIQVPETILIAAPEFFARLLASIGPA